MRVCGDAPPTMPGKVFAADKNGFRRRTALHRLDHGSTADVVSVAIQRITQVRHIVAAKQNCISS
jgi:hypothetical protein